MKAAFLILASALLMFSVGSFAVEAPDLSLIKCVPQFCQGYDGYGGPCYKGYGGAVYDGYGGPCYTGYGGPLYSGYGGPLYDGYGGNCYSGYGGACSNSYGSNSENTCSPLCGLKDLLP